ncbi:glycosyltransferase family 4 protein [Paenibacillus thermoaerophilus]|uniref:Glycosyltransferase family 4 protein n=1 Tax=Paenibacillus thermoaerophilus TaxID=1215385 RepID=A0ABW2UYS1_9BACL|nr:glycosyltransferase family 4 protein [Paenibacillus thermoaerophilus]TMV15858.1 glycosyltransferase family 4 protein [Paenibacillus thermoaerophilus]
MHLLIIAPEQIPVPPVVGGSVEHSLFQIARHMPAGHKVTIVSRHKTGWPRKSVYGRVTILRVNGGRPMVYLSRALARAKGGRYDLVQIDNRPRFVTRVRQAFPGIRVAVFLHSTTFVSSPMTTRARCAADLAAADLIVANSRSLLDWLRNRYPAIRRKLRYVHLGADLRQFRPPGAGERAAARRAYGSSGGFTVLFAGRLIRKKGIPVLMRALRIVRRSVPAAKLLIAGGTGKPGYISELKRLARSLGVPARFQGYVSRRNMHRFYWAGDCFVCPSQGHEAFGLVNVEAMASGTPLVASRIGGIPEIVRHGVNGLLVREYRNPAAFAAQLLRIARDPAGAMRMARQARRDAIRRFGWNGTAAKLIKLYGGGSAGRSGSV